MHPDSITKTQGNRELELLRDDHAMACRRLAAAKTELTLAMGEESRARARYTRKALWIKADKLRDELARVENEAANIRMED